MNRRTFLKFSAVAPIAAKEAIGQMELSAAQSVKLGPLASLGSNAGPLAGSSMKTFTVFEDWWKECRTSKRTISVHEIDPDILCLNSMSLTAKIRKQRDRNFDNYKREQKDWFLDTLKNNGSVSW